MTSEEQVANRYDSQAEACKARFDKIIANARQKGGRPNLDDLSQLVTQGISLRLKAQRIRDSGNRVVR